MPLLLFSHVSLQRRAFRETLKGKANKTWRVLHRVTYVESPALMGFGQDIRNLGGEEDTPQTKKLLSRFEQLELHNNQRKKFFWAWHQCIPFA
ncbi:hypothetical protein [Calothrix sp. NIES-2098]|uniref:hypothetical protein n=1 Tax=Calothrix sp. NIES-2098 TaxID=1954171 RepID=UPI000BBC2F58